MRRKLLLVLGITAVVGCAHLLGLKKADKEAFSHRTHVLKGVACVKCHKKLDQAGDKGPLHMPSQTDCVTCHDKPHDSRPCLGCHSDDDRQMRTTMGKEHIRFRHDTHLKRMPGNCVRCHTGIADEEDSSLVAPMAVCLSCHAHKDEFKLRKFMVLILNVDMVCKLAALLIFAPPVTKSDSVQDVMA
ncbi:MAG: hypothetical protein IPJ88_16850 [Myxococcales bacterium]|nr:MAG: hypothetical protein IPJ88_16850 [Myxococcales bacterium]